MNKFNKSVVFGQHVLGCSKEQAVLWSSQSCTGLFAEVPSRATCFCFIEDEVFAAFLLELAVQPQVCDRALGLGCVSVPADQAVQFALQPCHTCLRDADPARPAPLHLLLQPPCGQQHQAAGRSSSPCAPRATAAQSSEISGSQVGTECSGACKK